MKRAALVAVLLLATFAPAARAPDEYPITVHVTSSYYLGSVINRAQGLNVVIDGRKYVLRWTSDALLAIGDYKAKLTKDEHKTTYESYQEYELLFSDKKTSKFVVVGQSE